MYYTEILLTKLQIPCVIDNADPGKAAKVFAPSHPEPRDRPARKPADHDVAYAQRCHRLVNVEPRRAAAGVRERYRCASLGARPDVVDSEAREGDFAGAVEQLDPPTPPRSGS